MLILLHIENIAVIERADIAFSKGFTVLSGETGAGKSIIIDAIGAIMGQRTSRELIRNGAEKGFVSAVFSEISPALRDKISELGLESDDAATLHIQRELSSDGKSICRVNMRPVSANVLKSLSSYLINIHGQHDGQKLMAEENHIDFLDNFCGTQKIIDEYLPLYNHLFTLKRNILELEKNEQERLQRIDMLRYHVEEIEEANLNPDEESELSERKAYFDNAGKIAHALAASYELLSGSDDFDGACSALSQVSNELASVSEVSEEINTLFSKAEEIKFLAEDLSASLASMSGKMEFSEQERSAVEERLEIIFKLKRKYGSDIPEILQYYQNASEELLKLEASDEAKEDMRLEYKETLKKAKELAAKLYEIRAKGAKKLQGLIVEQLADLDMTKVKLEISVEHQQKLNSKGMDAVTFLISTNAGEPVKPLSKIASGGELSRIMLAMKNVLTDGEDVGTLIFDEIDAGVSGRAAQKIAKKLFSISGKKQTLCVTHLPQIAAMGDNHLLITKSSKNEKTFTDVAQMSLDERYRELARMISGDNITALSLKNAEELIANAMEYKRGV